VAKITKFSGVLSDCLLATQGQHYLHASLDASVKKLPSLWIEESQYRVISRLKRNGYSGPVQELL